MSKDQHDASNGGPAGPDSGSGNAKAAQIAVAAAGGMGCLTSPVALIGGVVIVIIIGGFGVLLAPLIALILLFGGGGSDPADQADEVVAAFEGDGKGALDPDQVPADLVQPIEDAGRICDKIGPIVIAAQIEKESNFDRNLVGPNGAQGISQLPPDVFSRFGKDDDNNGSTSALDPRDSIMAQGRYLCSLIGEVQSLIDSGQAIGNALDLALAAYHVGIDAVRQAGGIPNTSDAQGYVVSIRATFAKYQGIGAPPTSFPPAPSSSATSPSPAAKPS